MSGLEPRLDLVAAAARSVAEGLNHGTTGNLSVRTARGFLVTPTGGRCEALDPADLVELDLEGHLLEGHRAPSSEWRLHADLYRARPETGAVVHAHPVFATTLACLRMELPAVHYMIAVTGASRVRCARYATFGTAELSVAMLEVMDGSRACLLANHGLVATGTGLEQALAVATEVEQVAELYWRALQIGSPTLLSEAELAEVLTRFASYGPSALRPPAPPHSRPLPDR